MSWKSNFNSVEKSLINLGETFNLRRRRNGAQKRIGEEMADVASDVILARTIISQATPDGTPLAELRPSTIKRKIRIGAPLTIGVERWHMLTREEMTARVIVSANSMTMIYGLDPVMAERAEHFQEGRPGVQEARPFYDLGDDGMDAEMNYIDAVAEQAREEFDRG